MRQSRVCAMLFAILSLWAVLPTASRAGAISVTNPQVQGNPPSNGNGTVTADVTVTGLDDGEYPVSVVITNETMGGESAQTEDLTVTIKNGKGTLSVIAMFPPANPGDSGLLQIEVDSVDTGDTGAAQGGFSWPGGGG